MPNFVICYYCFRLTQSTAFSVEDILRRYKCNCEISTTTNYLRPGFKGTKLHSRSNMNWREDMKKVYDLKWT